MKRYRIIGILILAVLVVFGVYSCGQQEAPAPATTTTTTTTSTTTTITPGYAVYSGTDPSGQKFSFEYLETWTTSQETLTSSWGEGGTWIMFKGPGNWETGVPVLSLWIVPKDGTLTDEASYNAEAYSDRNVFYEADNTGPGLILESSTTETVTNLSLTAEGWRITYRTRLPLGRIYPDGDLEIHELMAGELVTAESEWLVFQKGNCLYDLNFEAVGAGLSSREAAYLHARSTFRFD